MANSTLKQIAEELGLSISTVSRAINGKTVVKPATRDRVMALAEKYHYSPNQVARALQRSSTQTIAVVLPDISETFFGTIVKEIDRVVSALGYMLILADTHEKAEKEHHHLQMLYTRRVDALVLATVVLDGSSVRQFASSEIPVVFIDNVPALSQADAITIDNRKASRMAVEHLAERGHRQIAAIIGSEQETTGAERLAGYRAALREHGLAAEKDLVAYGDYKRDSGYRAMKKLIAGRAEHPFTAVYVTSEKMTYGAMQAIREAGLRVPEDLSLVGFDIHAADDCCGVRITSVRQPEETIGRLVGEQLLKRLAPNGQKKQEWMLLDPYLEEGDTVRSI
ncbi:MAG: LacI family DNA-binding transcriptional regulator [Clostridia bacterium]|nr:LacI family DNA-binding transcriptional regulator [Clostridia bacterium]